MKNMNSLKSNMILGTVFVLITGTISHFIYDWSGQNYILGLIFPTNESTWEHLKLVFSPMLLLTIIQIFFFKNSLPDNFLCARLKGTIAGMLSIVVIFYTIWGVFGKPFEIVNILLYYVSVIYGLWIENKNYKNDCKLTDVQAAVILLILCVAFFVFTYNAPAINIFRDPGALY